MHRLLVVFAALWLVPLHPAIAKDKHKAKQKSFEPAALSDPRQYAGRYVGIEGSFWVDVGLGSGGALEVVAYEHAEGVPLKDVALAGAHLHAVAPSEGPERPFDATFGYRVVNGERSFGLLVEGALRIADDVVLDRVFYRRSADAPR